MTVFQKMVVFGEVYLISPSGKIHLDSDVICSKELSWCLRCGSIIPRNMEVQHKEFHKQLDQASEKQDR